MTSSHKILKQRMNTYYGKLGTKQNYILTSPLTMNDIMDEMIEDTDLVDNCRKELVFLESNLELIIEVKYVRPHKKARYGYRMALKSYLNGETDKIDVEAIFKNRVASLHIVYMTKENDQIVDKTAVVRMPSIPELCSKNEISTLNAVLSHVEEITQVTIDEFTEGTFQFL